MVSSAATLAAEMDCPACLAQLAPSGKLTVYKEPDVVKEQVFKSDLELAMEQPDEIPNKEPDKEPDKESIKETDKKKPSLKTLFTGKKGKK